MENFQIVDVTGAALAKLAPDVSKDGKADLQQKTAGSKKSDVDDDEDAGEMNKLMKEVENIGMKLPSTLAQTEIRSPTEDKDVFAYYFLLKVS
jgi:hypothetical protein